MTPQEEFAYGWWKAHDGVFQGIRRPEISLVKEGLVQYLTLEALIKPDRYKK